MNKFRTSNIMFVLNFLIILSLFLPWFSYVLWHFIAGPFGNEVPFYISDSPYFSFQSYINFLVFGAISGILITLLLILALKKEKFVFSLALTSFNCLILLLIAYVTFFLVVFPTYIPISHSVGYMAIGYQPGYYLEIAGIIIIVIELLILIYILQGKVSIRNRTII